MIRRPPRSTPFPSTALFRSLTYSDAPTPGPCPQGYSVTRTWTAKDCTGNTSTRSQTIARKNTPLTSIPTGTSPAAFCFPTNPSLPPPPPPPTFHPPPPPPHH